MSNEGAYETKVMLGSINNLVYETLKRLVKKEKTSMVDYSDIENLSNALSFVEIILKKYEHVECPQLGFSDEDYNEMQSADDNRP
jgi:hypothetical protein